METVPVSSSSLSELAGTDADALQERLRRLEQRLERERRARGEAERLLESKSRQLYEANQSLTRLALELDRRVDERTRELSAERQQALRRAEIDTLTGIANRASFARQLSEELASPQALDCNTAVLLLDLDNFKAVNDNRGHAAGDAVLVEFARRLASTVRPRDLVARLGGDEFAVLARGVRNRQGLMKMAQRLLRTLSQPVRIDGHSQVCLCSIGMADAASSGTQAEALLGDADMALYATKRAGRAGVTAFDPSLRIALERRNALEAELRQALAERHFVPWYQPVVHYGSGQQAGAELLARWQAADDELRLPGQFLEALERLGLLDEVMESLLRQALREAAPLVAEGRLPYLAVNVAPSQFGSGWPLQRLPELLAEAGMPPSALVIEITETALLRDTEGTRAMLAALSATGMRIALDDFGIGYSNFALLRQLPIHMLKLDRTLISDIEHDSQARALAQCILELAARLRIQVVVEGVETHGQAELLAAVGAETMQGFWFSHPQRELLMATNAQLAEAN